MINVFVSRPIWTPRGVTPFMQEFYELLERLGFNPKTIGTNTVPMKTPFDEVRFLMQQCQCSIVLGLHQIVADNVRIKGIDCGHMVLPTEWNQIEATASLMLDLPTLVLLHENVAERGVFERGAANLFVHRFRAQQEGWAQKLEPALLALKTRVEHQ